jgi:FtsZ-binding cell division protein ZapB
MASPCRPHAAPRAAGGVPSSFGPPHPTSQDLARAGIGLARSGKPYYADAVASGHFPPHPLRDIPIAIQILVNKGWPMPHKNSWTRLALALALCLPLAACKDTKTLQENEQLKAQVAQLQKENGQAQNDLDAMTTERDGLKKENEQLRAEIKALKSKGSAKKVSRKHRRS